MGTEDESQERRTRSANRHTGLRQTPVCVGGWRAPGGGVPLTRAHGRAWEASGHFSVVARPLLKENTNHPESGLFWKVVTRPELKGKTLWQETRPVSAAWKLFRHRSGRRLDIGTRTGLPRRPRRRDAGSPAGRARCRAGDCASVGCQVTETRLVCVLRHRQTPHFPTVPAKPRRPGSLKGGAAPRPSAGQRGAGRSHRAGPLSK